MRYLKQFGIIILISFVGELLHEFLPFSVPASIYGLVIMLAALMTGVLKVSHVKEASTLLLEIMPVMFIPAGAGLMESWGILREMLVPAIIICIVSTVIVMAVTGGVTQGVIKCRKTGNRRRAEVSKDE